MIEIPTNKPLLCSYNDNEGNHHGCIIAIYRNGRFYSGLYPINRVTGWREIPKEGFNVIVFNSDLSKPKTPEVLLIEEPQTKLVKNNAVDNCMLAANIISGDIEVLTYNSDIESAVKSVIDKNLDGDL